MPFAVQTILGGVLLGAASAAFAADDPAAGKALFLNTPAASGKPGITMSCPQCHVAVETRRASISGTGDPYADITFDAAMTHFTNVLQHQPAMQQFQALDLQQVRNIATYIADTPKTSPVSESLLNFTTTAINTTSAPLQITVRHGITASDNLTIANVSAIGTEAGNYTVQPACNGIVLAPGGSCAFSVTYAPRNTNSSTPDLVIALREGTPPNDFERVLSLNGSVSATPPAGGSDDAGGGALGLGWLAALAAATGLLARRRR